MKIIQKLLLYCCATLTISSLIAQVENFSAEKLKESNASGSSDFSRKKEWIASNLGTLNQIKSFEYISERNKPDDIVYEKVLWREMASDFYFELLFVNKKDNSVIQRSVSFVDNQTCTLFPSERELHVKKGGTTLSSVEVLPSPLIAYSFSSVKGMHLSLENLKKVLVSEDFFQRISFQRDEVLEATKYSVFRINSVYDPELRDFLTYEIYVSGKDFPYPSIWKAYDSENVLIKQFNSIDTGKLPISAGAAFLFPKKYSIIQSKFRGTITGPNGIVKYFPFKTVNNFPYVSINHLDGGELTIDPVLADYIFDIDGKKNIRVVK